MQPNERVEVQLHELASYLGQQRSAILTRWQSMTQSDVQLAVASSLSRPQLYDHIPDILDAFEQQISARRSEEVQQASADRHQSGAGHGLQRWQQGYQLREVMREWRHLHLCLFDELARFERSRSDLEPDIIMSAVRTLAVICSDGACESAAQYAGLQQAEAASRVRDLQLALDQLSDLGRARAELLREAAHDLRGNVGVVKIISAVLNDVGASEEMRATSVTILESSVETLHAMLEDLMSLARLEAGHERRVFDSFDASELVLKLCESLQSSAQARNLFLRTDGPTSLLVQGDAVKTRRIIQNLVLNGLKYTDAGGVVVRWHRDPTPGSDRWVICVQDTGPGFQINSVTPFARVLKRATEEAQIIQEKSDHIHQPSAQTNLPPTLPALSSVRPLDQLPGEGIGLVIVKRLCDLLDASMELETEIGRGTTFRVILPTSADGRQRQ
jgi:signal transduction histidine kinase